jgi:hypothetical protein
MAVNYATALKGTRMQAVLDAIDINASPAFLEICSAAYASVLATITLADPSFTRSGAVLTMAGVPKSDTSADNTGTAAIARIKDGGGNVIVDGLTVGTSGTDIVLSATALIAGQTVTLTAGTITHS